MAYPPQQPYGQQPQPGPYQGQSYGGQPPYPPQQGYPQQAPAQYGHPHPQQYGTGGYQIPQQIPAQQQMPMPVQQVGMSVTRPAWTCGEIALVVCTCGLAWPIVWMRRRAKTTYTRHR